MIRITTIKELCEFIWFLEDKYNLLDFEIDGVKVWQYKRMDIYYDLAQKLNILTQPHGSISKKEKVKKLFSFVKNSILYNPIFYFKKIDKLVIPHSRVKTVNNIQIDIYTHYFCEDLLTKNIKFLELETALLGKHYTSKKKYRYYNDYIILASTLLNKFISIKNPDLNKISLVNNEIKNILGKDYNLNLLFGKAVKKFKIETKLYSHLLNKIKPKEIYLVVSYVANAPLINAAKKQDIDVFEFQHGTFSKYHLGYSFPNRKSELDYFPNKFLVWNQFWKEIIDLPIHKDNIIINKFLYLEKEKEKYKKVQKIQNRAIVISQGAISSKISQFILNRWNIFKKFEIIYKLHPGEIDTYKNNKALLDLNKKSNVTIDLKNDLYELFLSSEYQIGVFSTAIYEGVDFGCKTILLDLPGIEYMDKFIKFHNIEVIK